MASFKFRGGSKDPVARKHWIDSQSYANSAIAFTGLGILAENKKRLLVQVHLYALAIELAFKCLALRAGASLSDCKRAGHKISKVIELIENHGFVVPDDLKRKLNHDDWFSKMVGARYPVFEWNPTFENTLFLHSNYPEIIASILEIKCDAPLSFEGGSAMAEIEGFVASLLSGKQSNSCLSRAHSGHRTV